MSNEYCDCGHQAYHHRNDKQECTTYTVKGSLCGCSKFVSDRDEQACELAALRAEVAELWKDRERLEWLFTNAYYVYSMNGPNGEEYFYVYDSNGTQISEFHCDGPREAIDAAIEAAAKGGEQR